jgi:hypothetical protein
MPNCKQKHGYLQPRSQKDPGNEVGLFNDLR